MADEDAGLFSPDPIGTQPAPTPDVPQTPAARSEPAAPKLMSDDEFLGKGSASAPGLMTDQEFLGTAPAKPRSAEYQHGYELAQDPNVDLSTAVRRGVNRGMWGNLTDRAIAAGYAGYGWLQGKGFSDTYNRISDLADGYQAGLTEKYPKGTIGSEIVGAVAPAIPASKFITATKFWPRVAQSAEVGAALGAFSGFAGGSGAQDRVKQSMEGSLFGGVLGGAGEGVISGAGALYRGAFGASNAVARFVPKGGGSPHPHDPEIAALAANEYGIPLTRGQTTAYPPQQAWETAALKGKYGEAAKDKLSEFAQGQAEAVDRAKSNVFPTTEPVEAGDTIAQGFKDAAAELRSKAEGLYDSAAAKDAHIHTSEISNLGANVARDLADQGIELDKYGSYPGASAGMNILKKLSGFEEAPSEIKPGKALWRSADTDYPIEVLSDPPQMRDGRSYQKVKYGGMETYVPHDEIVGSATDIPQSLSLDKLEQARKALIKVKAANAEDGRALSAIRSSYDSWVDNAIDGSLFSGDKSALDDLKQARDLWSQYRGLTTGSERDTSNILNKIVNEDHTGEQVANWLFGSMTTGAVDKSVRLATELESKLGADSPAWEALRRGVWSKVANPTNNTPEGILKSIGAFINKDGKPLAEKLYTPDELENIKNFIATLEDVARKPLLGSVTPGKFEKYLRMVAQNLPSLVMAGVDFHESHDPIQALVVGAAGHYFGHHIINPSSMKASAALRSLPRGPLTAPRAALQAGINATTPTVVGSQKRGGRVNDGVRNALRYANRIAPPQ